jgi:hypothetical protein
VVEKLVFNPVKINLSIDLGEFDTLAYRKSLISEYAYFYAKTP